MKVIAKQNRELLLINAQNTQNENKAETITLTVPEEFENFNKKIVFITDDGIVWDVIQDNTYSIKKAITKYKQVDFYIWLTKDDVDFRTKTKTIKFYQNQDASEEITEEEISGVNTVVNILEDEITKVEGLEDDIRALITDIQNKLDNGEFDGKDGADGKDGQKGQDGYTPVKGVDYFTASDIQEIENNVIEDITPTLNNKANKDELPTSLADLSSDSTHRTVTDTEKTTWNNKSDFSGSYTDLTNNPFILRDDEAYSYIDINSLAPQDGSSVCYQFLNPVLITNLAIGYIELVPGDQLSINLGSAGVVCASGNYYLYPSSIVTEQGIQWAGNYCVDKDELDLLLEPKVEAATMEQELAKKLSNSLIEEKDLLVTYEDTTTETLKLVVYK